jgi:threonine aldolase
MQKNMLHFDCDYNNGMHPALLKSLERTNSEYSAPYGFDVYSKSAKAKLREACGDPEADVFFLAGGTQTNSIAIASLLKPWQGVVSAESGHINVHEAGAVEYTGHKVISLPEHDGKLEPKELEDLLKAFHADDTREHMVEPGLVYISFPSELGTLYSAKELKDIYAICQKYGIKLFVDGARLAYGLAADGNDITLKYLAEHCDAFYIGGTKCGAICGEALVFPRKGAPERFFTRIKQHGALLAKGRLVALQFDALFTDGLYLQIGRHGNELAMRLQKAFSDAGIAIGKPSSTNQQFIILSKQQKAALEKHAFFEKWCPIDENHYLCRFVTSWSTTTSDIDKLENILKAL